jgi:hypothetical protein
VKKRVSTQLNKHFILLTLGFIGLAQMGQAADNTKIIHYLNMNNSNEAMDDSYLPSYLKNEKSNNTCLVCLI